MPITDADIRFRASERMTDFSDGGGRMSTTVIVDNVDNNVFPDVTDVDRLTGRVSLRKVYAAVLNADTDVFLSTHVLLDTPPTDAATSAVVFGTGGLSTTRAEVQAAAYASDQYLLNALVIVNSGGSLGVSYNNTTLFGATWTAGGAVVDLGANSGNLDLSYPSYNHVRVPSVGASVVFAAGARRLWRKVTARSVQTHTTGGAYSGANTITVDAAMPADVTSADMIEPTTGSSVSRMYGCATAPANSSSGANAIVVDSTWARIVPIDDGNVPTAVNPAWNGGNQIFPQTAGRVPVFREGDAVLIHNTIAIAPQTVSNGQTVNVSRTSLARLRVIGSTGVEHFRATSGQPSVGSGATADLAAGTVTFSDVSGMAQPVTIEHRIEEMALATTVTGTSVGINRALSRTYPAGTRVSSLLMCGDLQGRVAAGFAQQAWTGVWADAQIGGAPIGDFNSASHPITTTNAGAVTERWAVIFTNTTSYRVIGESLGEIGTGNTGANFAPVNPATGVPFFTLPAAGWGSGWAAGNVYRFNSLGASTPVWALRCVAPSAPAGDDYITPQLRGYVNT